MTPIKWTREVCLLNAKTFSSFKKWRFNARHAYQAARKYGFLDECKQLFPELKISKYEYALSRFLNNINKTKTCWLWTAGRTQKGPYGYGVIRVGRKIIKTHRFSWEFFNKKQIPKGLHVLHHCDVPLCVNPKHLFLGTQNDNNLDKKLKGRTGMEKTRGSLNVNSKLKEKDIPKIKLLYKKGVKVTLIAKKYKIHETTVYYILRGSTWKHLTTKLAWWED